MRILLFGAPGCGKRTQGHKLAEKYKIPEISTGDLLREAVEAGTTLGRAAKAVMDAGQLVSDEIVLGVINERLKQPDVRKGFILDGFPRNVAQAEQLDNLLDQIGQPIDLAILIEVDLDIIMQRLLGRRTCVSCRASYNIFSAPPKMDDRCDECGGRLRRRADDNEETIGNRLRIYDTQMAPVIERCREHGRLRVVQGLGEIDDVFKALLKAVEETRPSFGNRDRSAAIRRAVARKQAERPETVPVEATGTGNRNHPDREPDLAKASAAPASTNTTRNKPVTKSASETKVAGKKTAKHSPAKKKVARKEAAKKKTVAKKKAASRIKPVNKAAAKKTTLRKKVTSKKKKVAPNKTAAGKKAAKKKTVAKKKVSSPIKPVNKAAAKKTALRKKVTSKKKKVAPKKTALKKKVTASGKAAIRKKRVKKTSAKKKAR